jgi:DNA end-binding protein Ku
LIKLVKRVWSGSITFGLVNLPVTTYSATETKEFSFSQLCPEGHKIKYKRICPVDDKEINYSEIQRGYELTKDQYLLINNDDLEKISVQGSKSINIREFVNLSELDPLYIEKSYYVVPDLRISNDKAYKLILKILNDSKKIAVGTIVIRDKEDIVILRAYQKCILMHTIKYIEEIRPTDEIPEIRDMIKLDTKISGEELKLAKTLVEKFTNKKLDLSTYKDTYTIELRKLIDAKINGKQIKAKPEIKVKESPDLLAALKASIDGNWSK